MLRALAKLLKVLNSEAHPGQVALGLCFGMVLGLTPLWSVHNVLVLLLVFVLRTNLSAFLLSAILFSGSAYLLDPVFHQIGLGLLTAGALQGVWTALYGIPLMRLTQFNNSVVMGSLVVSLALFGPMYWLSCMLIQRYREVLLARVRRFRIVQVLSASRLAGVYRTLGGGAP